MLPYLTNNWGSTAITKPGTPTDVLRVSDSTFVTTKSPSPFSSSHYRTGQSSNPPSFSIGFLRRWRNPSGYNRRQETFEAIIPANYKVGGFIYYVKNCYLGREDCRSHFIPVSTNPYCQPTSFSSLRSNNAEIDNARISATNKALSDLANKKASVGENLAQLVQTADSFVTLAKSGIDIVKAFNRIRKGQIPNLGSLNVKKLMRLVRNRKVEKRIANNWLAYWYGLQPLVGDAKGLFDLIKERQKPVLLVHGRGQAKLTWSGDDKSPSQSTYAPGIAYHDDTEVAFRCSISGRVDGQVIRNINRLGLLNIPSLAWELVPFSFCVDWLVPVGEVIDSMSATAGLTFVGGTITTRVDREIRCEVMDQWKMGNDSPISYFRAYGFERLTLSSWPIAKLRLKPFYTGLDRYATIAALISNLTSSGKKFR